MPSHNHLDHKVSGGIYFPGFGYLSLFELIVKYEPMKIYVDEAASAIIKALKIATNEDPEYEKVIA